MTSFPRWSLAAVLLLGCGDGRSSAATPSAGATAADAPRSVVTARGTPRPWPRMVILHGTLEPRESVVIAARVAGPVVRLSADLGDVVRAGRVLASISSTDLRARLAEADAELADARADLSRFEGLANPEAVSRREADQARTRVLTAEVAREAAHQNLRDTRILAPFDGVVARRHVSEGAFVRVGDPLFDFVSDGAMRLVLDVPERYVHEVVVGTKVSVRPERSTEAGLEHDVVRVAPTIDAQTRTFRVEASVDPRNGALRPGMFVLGTITLGTADDGIELPREAVYSVLGHDRVTLVVNGVAEPRDVELVGEHEGKAIVRGISAQDEVIVRGPAAIAPGTRVVAGGAQAEAGR